jgi:hypothetical protein
MVATKQDTDNFSHPLTPLSLLLEEGVEDLPLASVDRRVEAAEVELPTTSIFFICWE